MRLMDIFKYSLESLKHRQMRSWLTILGIVIGIASVVALLTIGEGFNAEVNRQLSALGSDTISITPSTDPFANPFTSPSSGKLFESDAERLKRIPEITDISRVVYGRASVGYKDKQITTLVMGIDPDVFQKMSAIEIENGRFLQANDRKVVAVGGTFAEDAFGAKNRLNIGTYLLINGEKYPIIAVLKKSGGGFGPNTFLDNGVFISYNDGKELFRDSLADREVNEIDVNVRDGADMDSVVERITLELASAHKLRVEDKDFSVVDPKSIQSAVDSVLSLITLFLGAIAGISLLVGALSIANNMFTSVFERTHEIGVLKAVGATKGEIMRIFVFEAGAVGAIGGLAGVLLGYGLGLAANLFGLPTSINLAIGAFGVMFAFVIGLISGYVPARMASSLNPVDALRYE
ncbi:TPA: ABC transporter permease [Candidatus Micrarchaeota archaeon]|nr:ABC transporter permease [Candidatus Micrarchaeota archaeon]HIH29795.1 ABC transporter permease [Candidatus Micrarchaeota archaeon]